MQKSLLILLFTAVLPAMALADAGPFPASPAAGNHQGPGEFFQKLDLSEAQQQQVGVLMQEDRRNRREIIRRYIDKLPSADREALQQELKVSREKHQGAFRALLTPEQQKKLDQLKPRLKPASIDQ